MIFRNKDFVRLLTAFAIGSVLIGIPFFRVFFSSQEALLYRDLLRDILVQKKLLMDSLRAGQGVPLWNYTSFGGIPYWAINVSAPLNPLNTLFYFFPPGEEARGLVFYVFAHYLVFLFSAMVWLKPILKHWVPATLLSVALTCSGYQLSVHSLVHILVSISLIPWFFIFLRKIKEKDKSKHFYAWLLGIPLGWPIYGGDPQFAYVLALCLLGYLFFLYEQKNVERVKILIVAACSSFLFCAAQLLPTLELTWLSSRLQTNTTEALLFSFHPYRVAETFFPLLFGNRYGYTPFWAEDFVNFPYKTPFIFSTYLTALTIYGLLYLQWRNLSLSIKKISLICLACVISCFGYFSFIPLYEWATKIIPFFSLFRYPERLLFWPALFLFYLSALSWKRIFDGSELSRKDIIPFGLFISSSLGFLGLAFFEIVKIPQGSIYGVITTILFLSILSLFHFAAIRFHSKKIFYPGIFLVLAMDLFLNQSMLIWNQPKSMVDLERNRVAKLIQVELEKSSASIQTGGPFRFSTFELPYFRNPNPLMDHATLVIFNSMEALDPNVHGLFGLHSVTGYYSLIPKRTIDFYLAAIRQTPTGHDYRYFNDLMSTKFLPTRDQYDIPAVSLNPTAQPYVFFPDKIHYSPSEEDGLKKITSSTFSPNKDAVLIDANKGDVQESNQSLGSFEVVKKAGSEMHFRFHTSAAGRAFVTLNESYDKNWKLRFGEKTLPIELVNGWSMGFWIDSISVGETVDFKFSYESPWIFWGCILTALWFAMMAAFGFSRLIWK